MADTREAEKMAKEADKEEKKVAKEIARIAKYGDYNPYEFREQAHGTNYIETMANMIKASVGTGFLMMPQSFMYAGMIGGTIGCVALGFFCIWGLHLLIKCQLMTCQIYKEPFIKMPYAMKKSMQIGPKYFQCLANMSPYMVNVFILINQVGICCVYVLFVASNMKAVIDVYTTPIAIEFYILALLPPFIIINLIPNMKILAIISMIALAISFTCIGIILYYILTDLPDINERSGFGNARDFALFIGTVLFSIEAPGVVIGIEAEMKDPPSFVKWYGALNTSLILVIFIYIGMGVIGFWKYGDTIASAIILSLPQTDKLAIACKAMYALYIFLSFPINCYVPVRILWDEYIYERIKDRKHLYCWEVMVRALLVVVSVCLAAAVPLLGLFISLVGVLSLTTLGFVFPAMMDVCLRYPDDYGTLKYHILKDILIGTIGLAAFIIGTYVTIWEITVALIELRQ